MSILEMCSARAVGCALTRGFGLPPRADSIRAVVDGAGFRVATVPRGDASMLEALATIRSASRDAGYGLYLGAGNFGLVWAPPEQAVLVLGPPRSG